MQHQSDAQLLRDYAAHRSEPAFAEIVARHTDLVYSAALRQTGSPELAREIAQSVFTDLARKARALAGTLSADASLAGWLFRGTRFAGLKWLRDDHRRQTHERQFMEHFNPAAESAPDWERIAPVLDEAMAELDDADHEAVLLRYFQNKDFHAVGRALGVSDDTAQKRVSRAVERLREFFADRGITVGASGLVLVISANSVQAAPVELAGTITSASLVGAASETGTALNLLKLMAMTKMKLGLIGAIAAAIVVTPVAIHEFAGEPSFGGKTVTQWLDSLQLYTHEQRPDGVYIAYRDSKAIAADPAIRALAAIGPRAVPVLMRRISEPAELSPTLSQTERWKIMTQWKLFGKRGPGGNYPESQVARKYAAGVALLMFGTNAHGGFSRFVDAYVATPPFTSVAGGRLTGAPAGIAASPIARLAAAAFPERHEEIVTEMMALLQHTNANYRQAALESARDFPAEALKQKELLLKLTLDEGQYVQMAALATLNSIARQPQFRALLSPSEVRQGAARVAEAPNITERNRDYARQVIRQIDELIGRAAIPPPDP